MPWQSVYTNMSGSKARAAFFRMQLMMKAKSPKTTVKPGEMPVEELKPNPAMAATGEVSKKAEDKVPSPRQQLTIQAIHALRIWQQETVNAGSRAIALDVAKLALELARLHGKTNPQSFLDEAVRLLTEAKFALGREQARPEREQREQRNKFTSDLADELRGHQVPFTKLCRPAGDKEKVGASELPAIESFSFTNGDNKQTAFEWRVYRDERDFKTLLAKHAKRIYQYVGKRLASIKISNEPDRQHSTTTSPVRVFSWGEAAVNMLDGGYWLPVEWREKFSKVKTSRGGAKLTAEYVAAATPAFTEILWRSAKGGLLDVVTIHAINETRRGTYKARGRSSPKPQRSNI